jgi:hypothetical protein
MIVDSRMVCVFHLYTTSENIGTKTEVYERRSVVSLAVTHSSSNRAHGKWLLNTANRSHGLHDSLVAKKLTNGSRHTKRVGLALTLRLK